MSEFAFVYRSGSRELSADEMQAQMVQCLSWFKDLMDRGVIKDPGVPLNSAGAVISGSQRVIHDGPFAEAKDIVSGFTLIEANSLAEAIEVAKGCPIADFGGIIEVRPVGQIGGCSSG